MSENYYKWIQRRLGIHGFPCQVDGFPGVETRGSLRAFQRREHLRETGTDTAETVAALRRDRTGKDTGPANVQVIPPWYAEMLRRKGLHEVRDHGILSRWLKSDGRTLGDPRKLPWCGDGVQTAIALTVPEEPQLANPYLARNWLRFGQPTQPRLGAILIFDGGSRPAPAGHVGLYAGEDAGTFHVLGANQSNAITIAKIAKKRLLGARWPLTDTTKTAAINQALNGAPSTSEA